MKRIGFPKNGNLSAFFANCREPLECAFREKTPPSVRKCRVGWICTFFLKGLPKPVCSILTNTFYNLDRYISHFDLPLVM